MLHVVTQENRNIYAAQIDEMHRIRKTIFVDRMGWQGPTVMGDQEFDAYDDSRAVYLLGLDSETGAVRSGIRMRPADECSLLGDVFEALVDGGRKRVIGPDVWEGTRMFAAPDARSEADKRLMREIYVGMVELGVKRGYRRFTGLGDVKSIPFLRNGGWRYKILGAPVEYDDGEWFAFETYCGEEELAAMRDQYGLQGPLLFELPKIEPCHAAPHELAALAIALQSAGYGLRTHVDIELREALRQAPGLLR